MARVASLKRKVALLLASNQLTLSSSLKFENAMANNPVK